MAETYVEQNQEIAAQRAVRLWAMGFLLAAALMVVLGFALAAGTTERALPWTGTAFVMAMGLALVVGASKTSSA